MMQSTQRSCSLSRQTSTSSEGQSLRAAISDAAIQLWEEHAVIYISVECLLELNANELQLPSQNHAAALCVPATKTETCLLRLCTCVECILDCRVSHACSLETNCRSQRHPLTGVNSKGDPIYFSQSSVVHSICASEDSQCGKMDGIAS